jgi:hypothetical protein
MMLSFYLSVVRLIGSCVVCWGLGSPGIPSRKIVGVLETGACRFFNPTNLLS